ncbi:MAG: hypothetical protein ABEH40_00550 [Haloferacaceae archaeon]
MSDDDDGAGGRVRTYVSYLLAVFFVVLIVGMAAVTVQLIVNGV